MNTKLVVFILASAGALSAQFQNVPSTSYPALEGILNAKPAVQTGYGAPGGSCTAGKDFYLAAATGTLSYCSSTNVWTAVPVTAANIVSLFSGCSGTQYLGADGSCHAASSGGGSATKTLYYAPAAKTIGGVGASVYQCSTSCGVPTAVSSGSSVTATYHAAIPGSLTSSSFWDQFVIPSGYANQQITVEVIARSVDTGHTGSVTVTSGQVGAGGDISNPSLGNSTTLTITPSGTSGGLAVATGTFTPSWSSGNLAIWKAVASIGSLSSDLEIISVRFYATF